MNAIPKIISQNPYRILGVYANSPKRDILSNKGKATAFLRTCRPVEFPVDLIGILPPLNRTLNLINGAEAHIAIAKEQIKYAQFWFMKITPSDNIALNYLLSGNMAKAKEIWAKQDSLSSLQNKALCFFIEASYRAAVLTAEQLYEKFGDTYINKVAPNCTLQMSGKDLWHLFLDTLGDEIGFTKLIGLVSNVEGKSYIMSKAVGPLIIKISNEVDKAAKVDHKDPRARIEAAKKLVANTNESLSQLKGILSVTDSQYQMIADKLGLEILQCGIDYFQHSGDDRSPYTAMEMLKKARSVVVGTLAKQRCEENITTLQKIIDTLPPLKVMAEDKEVKAELNNFKRRPEKISYAVDLLNNTKYPLQRIRQKLGPTNLYYLKISTQIVGCALHNVVEEVNAVQLGLGLETSSLDNIKSVLSEAWKTTLLMDGFDMEPSFKTHYNNNRNTLKSMCFQVGIPTPNPPKPDLTIPVNPSPFPPKPYTPSPPPSGGGSTASDGCIGCLIAIAGIVVFFTLVSILTML